ncbi:uncharacterized protein BO95DRAFT_469427 [Aspergillus brunneoviolaceus CBS 621.78]|uniref:Uncharacterized protein n=1 Tax=Aspergillus brunneoviolaceus CBS 621.78 TaxID=1450534 RepID=A0ACD1FS31_9EURO|nr:hypothetical protein BO95DRAFT_469427 [Aspergillus brunneoviolaceus CBS 621.78]RAH39783.1 hypothetical protein BO95DRAFT_469427 [Aspergillus brunneoviolaceus CBS 621.78]
MAAASGPGSAYRHRLDILPCFINQNNTTLINTYQAPPSAMETVFGKFGSELLERPEVQVLAVLLQKPDISPIATVQRGSGDSPEDSRYFDLPR